MISLKYVGTCVDKNVLFTVLENNPAGCLKISRIFINTLPLIQVLFTSSWKPHVFTMNYLTL